MDKKKYIYIKNICSGLLGLLLNIGREEELKCTFLAKRGKKTSGEGQSRPKEREVGLPSGPYLLVFFKNKTTNINFLKKDAFPRL